MCIEHALLILACHLNSRSVDYNYILSTSPVRAKYVVRVLLKALYEALLILCCYMKRDYENSSYEDFLPSQEACFTYGISHSTWFSFTSFFFFFFFFFVWGQSFLPALTPAQCLCLALLRQGCTGIVRLPVINEELNFPLP